MSDFTPYYDHPYYGAFRDRFWTAMKAADKSTQFDISGNTDGRGEGFMCSMGIDGPFGIDDDAIDSFLEPHIKQLSDIFETHGLLRVDEGMSDERWSWFMDPCDNEEANRLEISIVLSPGHIDLSKDFPAMQLDLKN